MTTNDGGPAAGGDSVGADHVMARKLDNMARTITERAPEDVATAMQQAAECIRTLFVVKNALTDELLTLRQSLTSRQSAWAVAIDLGQFREAVNCWRAVITTAAVNLPFNLAAYRASCGVSIPDRLLAIIDSQATYTHPAKSEEGAVVTDEMVERALEVFSSGLQNYYPSGYCTGNRASMRAALVAALENKDG